MGILYRLRHFVTKRVLIMIYNAFILPHISYGIEVWGGTYESYLNQILIIQKGAARAITFKHVTEHSIPLFYECKILDIKKLYNMMICSYMHDLNHERSPDYLSMYCSYIDHCHETRQKENNNLGVLMAKTNIGKQSFSYSVQ